MSSAMPTATAARTLYTLYLPTSGVMICTRGASAGFIAWSRRHALVWTNSLLTYHDIR